MYSLDVNFLKDRNLDTKKVASGPKLSVPSLKKQLPVVLGASALLLLPALAGSLLLFLGYQSNQTQENIKALDQQLTALNAQNQRIAEIEGKISGIDGEIKSLVGVFNQIKPWSALLEELAVQIPTTVRIGTIQQDNQALTLSGSAASYSDLNDFLINLQNSKFLKPDQTKLVAATLKEMPIAWKKPPPPTINVSFPKIVDYSIKTELNDVPSSDLKKELAKNGAVGLIARIQTLQQKGVLKP